jgi:hypothetical protein
LRPRVIVRTSSVDPIVRKEESNLIYNNHVKMNYKLGFAGVEDGGV